jgi:hypothetical protein
MADERRRETTASGFWAALTAAKGGSIPDGDLDPETADALRHLHRLTLSPPPAGARDRVDRAVERQRAALLAGRRHKETTDMNQLQARVLPHPGRPMWGSAPAARPTPVKRHHPFVGWHSLQAASTVLLVLALAGGFLALRPNRPDPRSNSFGSLPAAQASPEATPEPIVTVEPDVEFTDMGVVDPLPPEPLAIGFYRMTLAPDAAFTAPSGDPGLGVQVIESGTVTLRGFSDDITISRTAGDTLSGMQYQEVLQAGLETALEPGDSFVWPPFVVGEVRNDGTEPVVIASFDIRPDA